MTEIDLSNFSKQNISSGSSPLGIFFSEFNESIYVSNWYDNKLSIINNNFKKDIQIVEVGNSLQEFSYRNLVKMYLLQIEKTTIYMSLMLKNLN